MSLFPADDKARKGMPIFKLVTRYFPKALREVTKVSVANNVRYNPDRDPFDINWARGKSPDQLGSLFRHMMERAVDERMYEMLSPEVAAKVGYDHVYVLAEAAWRALAALELEIEAAEAVPAPAVAPPHPTYPYGAHAERRVVPPPLHEGWVGGAQSGDSRSCACGENYLVYETCGWRNPQGIVHGVKECTRG